MTASLAEIRALEAAAYAAWPAAEVVRLGGWRLRATAAGLTRRGNSIWPGAPAPAGDLEAALARAREHYAARELPLRFQLSPIAAPGPLDALLAERGFEIEAPVEVQTAAAADVLGGALPRRARCSAAACAEWLEVAGWRSRFGASEAAREGFLGFLERIGARAGFALAYDGERPAAAGLGVLDGRHLGVFAMFTLPVRRGRGSGREVLAALAGFARERGADTLYLQVERDNAPALRLYARAGFRRAYRYHYRREPAPRDAQGPER